MKDINSVSNALYKLSITTDTNIKKHVKDKTKITFNDKPVGYVMVDFIEWHVGNLCEECTEEDECSKCHTDLVDIDTYDFMHRLIANTKEFPDWKNGCRNIFYY
jgi:hypothetical protein